MLYWSAIFLVIAFVAGLFGFTGIAGITTDIARWTCVLFLLLLVLSLAGHLLKNLR